MTSEQFTDLIATLGDLIDYMTAGGWDYSHDRRLWVMDIGSATMTTDQALKIMEGGGLPLPF